MTQQQILIPFSPTKVQHLFGFCKHFGNFFSALIQKVLQNKNIIHTYLTN